jgi:iron complex outermembrane recepter protein
MQFKPLLFIVFICSALILKAQNKLTGTIRSTADSSSQGSAIIILPELNLQTLSEENGTFEISNLTQGYYAIQIIKSGFNSYSNLIYVNDSNVTKSFFIKPGSNTLNEIVIYGNQQDKRYETSNTIDVLSTKNMRDLGALNLSDGIAKLPGVSQLSTGAGISKPVIRGLFGNRIQTVLLGMRFDNQQWQDEHGLGLSDIGVDRIEIIKGASSLFYGSEAMGGVLNIINEKSAPLNTTQADISTRLFSNTYGYAIDGGVKRTTTKFNWGIRFGSESHADYSDGNGTRILNSRFNGNLIKASLGFKRKHWVSENNYLLSQNNFGFLMDAYQVFDKPDDRLSRSFERPHHSVLMNMFTSQNTLLLRASKLNINLGAHINNRQEQEGSAGISLDMLLKTYSAMLLWKKNLNQSMELSIGSQNQFQTNENLGSRIIVPNANLGEMSLFIYMKKKYHFLVAEGGLRYDYKNIQTFQTANLNNGHPFNPGSRIVPVNKAYNTLNGAFGISVFDLKHFNSKINITSGYRGPNLAELSSNGLHEGSLRYELGDVNLKLEQNLCGDFYVEYYNSSITLFASLYSNYFFNYIYLQPDSMDYLGFRIYNYVQKNANIKGVEGGIKLHPKNLSFVQLNSSYSGLQGQTEDKEYLPFIPAQKINTELRFQKEKIKIFHNSFFSLSYTYVLEQNTPNQFETKTKAYPLLGANIGTEMANKNKKIQISISANNLLNEVYYDHLSRFKYFGIYNIGRSISLNLKLFFN